MYYNRFNNQTRQILPRTTSVIHRSEQPLTNDQLRAFAPSIFATQPWHAMSDKYAFIPTSVVVDKMRSEGFLPVAATQSRTRIAGKGDFTKHLIRFRDVRNGDAPITRHLGQIYPELVLTNAHDGSAAYILDGGLYRLVCLNGMVVCDEVISAIRVRHTGDAGAVINATFEVVEQFPKVIDSVERFQQLRLNAPQQQAFAEAAIAVRYDEGEAPVTPAQVIQPNRRDDAEPTLWNTFNTVQENMVNGGIRYRNQETRRRGKTRPVAGISENTRLNKALWTLAEKMKELVA